MPNNGEMAPPCNTFRLLTRVTLLNATKQMVCSRQHRGRSSCSFKLMATRIMIWGRKAACAGCCSRRQRSMLCRACMASWSSCPLGLLAKVLIKASAASVLRVGGAAGAALLPSKPS
eukprot:scaffold180911_cov17-Tisochrysis_lutea.AAC.1